MNEELFTENISEDRPEQTDRVISTLHAQLVKATEKWMRNTIGCGVTFREFVAYTSTGEIPDVIGWVNGHCIMAEVKVSRADFLSDGKKKHRQPLLANEVLGHYRFYVTLPGIAKAEEIPEGWGLYELRGRGMKHIAGVNYKNCGTPPFQSNRRDEVAIMYSALRRLELRGVLERVYERI